MGGSTVGLTPAQAGTAKTDQWTAFPDGAHPRAGGDGRPPFTVSRPGTGSPPRRRGRPAEPGRTLHANGLTPAQAGTACGCPARSAAPAAHPRAGGDGVDRHLNGRRNAGSPPRRRGRRIPLKGPGGDVGLTPAQAGTAESSPCFPSPVWAHPRAGGDGDPARLLFWLAAGSPPRRRGRHRDQESPVPNPGLTPAQAGTAKVPDAITRAMAAHPRAGGDGVDAIRVEEAQAGSPPRRRGRRRGRRGRLWLGGLTPAQAGTAHVA